MDLLDEARNGFQPIQVDEAFKDQALRFLRQWLTQPEFAAYLRRENETLGKLIKARGIKAM